MSVQMILGIVLIAAAVAVPSFFLLLWAKTTEPRFESPRFKSGFGGWMIVFLVGQVAVIERLLYQGVLAAGSLSWAKIGLGENFFAAVVSVGPFFIQAALGIAMLFILITNRTPAALASAVILLWLMGPVAVLVENWYFSLVSSTLALTEIFIWAIGWTAYLAFSPRVALTYGTKRGSRIATAMS